MQIVSKHADPAKVFSIDAARPPVSHRALLVLLSLQQSSRLLRRPSYKHWTTPC